MTLTRRLINLTKRIRRYFIKKSADPLFKDKPYTKYILLGRARSGSSMLNTMLSSHPNIHGREELFGRLAGQPAGDVLNDVFSNYKDNVQAVGFKIHYNHPVDDDSGEIWRRLDAMDDLHVIHLKRKNILRSYVSGKIALKLNLFQIRNANQRPELEDRRVACTVEELRENFEKTRNWEIEFAKRFADKPYIETVYEELVANTEGEFAKLCDFLRIPYAAPQTRLKRLNPEKISDLIENYDDLKAAFAGTEWADFFED